MAGIPKMPTGSPTADEPAFILVGKIHRPHGIKGDVIVEIHTDYIELIQPQKSVFVGEKYLPLTISRMRNHKAGILIAFKDYITPEQVGMFRNRKLYISASERKRLTKGEYYIQTLIGLEINDENGTCLGKLTEIIKTGANDVYVLKCKDGREILLPATSEVVKKVDLEKKTITVHLIPGLVD